ncbi:MAG: hypothetical protein AAGE01_10575 [Pseudomonadota bacterium]
MRRALAVLLVATLWCRIALGQDAAEAPAFEPDFEHGRTQVAAVLADRPGLAGVLIADDPLEVWLTARFAGVGGQQLVYWDDTPPPAGIEAQHYHVPRTTVRVHPVHQSGPMAWQSKDAQDLWADLVFELYNVSQRPAFENAWAAVNAGEASLVQWLEEVARAEHRALLYSQAFYRTRWRPWMRERELPHLGLRWRQLGAVPTQFETWIRRYGTGDGYPYRDYGRAYEDVLSALRASGADWQIDPFHLPGMRVHEVRR